MIYVDLPAGASVFVDASVFIHHFEPNPLFGQPATEVLERIDNQVIHRITSTHVVSEVTHDDRGDASLRLEVRRHRLAPSEPSCPGADSKRFRQAIQEIALFNIRILAVDPAWLDPAAEVSQQTGLLHNDALTSAIMRAHGLTNLASADPDFDRVPGITRYAPP